MKERVFDLLTDAVSEIFLKIQTEEGIESGDCPFEIEYDIDKTCESLAGIMAMALELQKGDRDE